MTAAEKARHATAGGKPAAVETPAQPKPKTEDYSEKK